MIASKTLFCTILLFAFALAWQGTPKVVAESAPNIVVVLADDLGWNAVGYHNSEFQTPNIDSIATNGMELDRFYVAPMCSPTRAGLMTGRYPIRFGCARAVIPPYRDFGLPLSEATLPELLRTVGYNDRGAFGKWHLGHRRSKWHPLNRGFTHFHGHYNGAIDYFELTRDGQRDWHVGYQTSDEQGYATDLIAEAAAAWITRVSASDSPYFCYVPFNAPHSPFQAPAEAVEKYGSKAKRNGQKLRETYKAMVGRMDEGIGKILAAIDASGKADNTIVWFFSDNGGVGKLRELNQPLRGSKLTVFEGGIRVPACVRWPAKISPGTKSQTVCGYIDLLPTLLAAPGRDASTMTDRPLDGVDLMPVLTGETTAVDDTSVLAQRPWFSYHGQQGPANEHLAVLDQGWKLKVNGPRLRSVDQLDATADGDSKNEVQLFHLDNDPFEAMNLATRAPARVKKLAAMLVQHRDLQPKRSVPAYRKGRKGFVPPKDWKLDPSTPERLVGEHAVSADIGQTR